MMNVAIVRGKFLNAFEMQSFVPLADRYHLTAFGSLRPFHDHFSFPVVKLPSPMDLPEFPYKMPILNRIFTDAHYLFCLEERLQGFDLVHTAETYYRYTQQSLDAKKKGYVKKVIATVLENIPFNNEGIWGRKEYKKRARTELDHIIALTHKSKDALVLEGCDPSKITVIGHGIDTKRFFPSSEMQKKFKSKQKTCTVLFTGRLERYKGVIDIVDAARNLIADTSLQTTKLQFVFVGKGSAYRELSDKISGYGLTPYISLENHAYEDMPQVYQKADIFVAPSESTETWQEQYCTALLEAQATGLPIVTTNTGGIPENVGDAAVIVEPGDIAGITQALKQFILDQKLHSSFAAKARKRAETIHDVHIISRKIERVYEQIMDK